MDKIFLLADIQEPKCSINLKCNPEWALELRASYPAVQPGYHMNKKHWNTVEVDGSIPDEIVLKMIDHSYGLVVNGLTKKDKAILAEMTNSSNL
jgi:predicted DNA-binding protein (MmcQ/YjbR family)